MSIGAVSKIITNAGIALGPILNSGIGLLRGAKILHMDKTLYSVNGKRWSLWVFYDPQAKNAVYWLAEKDGTVLDWVLGDWDGIAACDGAPVFSRYRKRQRCWAHILRESHYIRRSNPGGKRARYVDDRLGKMYRDAKDCGGISRDRARRRYEFARRVRELAYGYGGDGGAAEFS